MLIHYKKIHISTFDCYAGVFEIKLIICEDNQNMVKRIINIIDKFNKFLSTNEEKIELALVTASDNGVIDYIQNNKCEYKSYILDIELANNVDGMLLAKDIRDYDKKGEIIFLTSHSFRAMHAFKYKLKVLDFIDKMDDVEDRLMENLKAIHSNFKSLEQEDEGIIRYRKYELRLSDIVSIETTKDNHKLRINTMNGQRIISGILKEIELELDEGFYKTHRSCIVK